jgi:hypothetical protein
MLTTFSAVKTEDGTAWMVQQHVAYGGPIAERTAGLKASRPFNMNRLASSDSWKSFRKKSRRCGKKATSVKPTKLGMLFTDAYRMVP